MDDQNIAAEPTRAQSESNAGPAEASAKKSAEIFDSAKDDLTKSLERLKAEIDDFNVEELRDKTLDWVKANPIIAVAAAAGVGIIIGKILRAGRDSETKPVEVPAATTQLVAAPEVKKKDPGVVGTVANAVKSMLAAEAVNRISALVKSKESGEQR